MIENLQHLISVSDLFLSITNYLQTIPVKNKPSGYTPTGTLVNGAVLQSGTTNITIPADSWVQHAAGEGTGGGGYTNTTTTKSVIIKTTTVGTIASHLLSSISNTKILEHFESFKNSYLNTIISNKKFISMSQALLVIFIVTYFIEKRFIYVYDKLGKSNALLYNTLDTIAYNVPSDIYSYTEMNNNLVLGLLNKINDVILNRNNIIYLNAEAKAYTSSGTASSSSSSCSSSCSSSSCSSSCSCSSSSGFILYLI